MKIYLWILGYCCLFLTYLIWKNISWNFDDFNHKAFNILKKAFTSTLILTYITLNNKVYLVVFYSQTFNFTKLNCNTHDKKLLTIFEAIWIWKHYLKSFTFPINIITDHKNLKYILITKVLTLSHLFQPTDNIFFFIYTPDLFQCRSIVSILS